LNKSTISVWVKTLGLNEKYSSKLEDGLVGKRVEDITESFLYELGIPGGPVLRIMKKLDLIHDSRASEISKDSVLELADTTNQLLSRHQQNMSNVFAGLMNEYTLTNVALQHLERSFTEEMDRISNVVQSSVKLIEDQMIDFNTTRSSFNDLQRRVVLCQQALDEKKSTD